MYAQEKDYILTGAVASLFFAIFGPAAVITIWVIVGICCLCYRQDVHKYEKKWGKNLK